jgi:TRAP-type C4-dicarboxylate transport system substrate-binding protein
MNAERILLEKWRTLPPEKQQEVLDFVDFLKQKTSSQKKRRSLKGLCADLGVSISEEDIKEVRQEMWKNFPREDI